MPIRWTADHIRIAAEQSHRSAPIIGASDVLLADPEIGIWDAWPVQDKTGVPLVLPDGSELWMALGAPWFSDPDVRHSHARIHLLLRESSVWHHLGPAMPDGFSPGSREWSGSAVADSATGSVTLYFTAAGRRGEEQVSFEQRLFAADATLDFASGLPRLKNWRSLREIVRRDPDHYMETTGSAGVGKIKAFRDPAYFQDPADANEYLLFAGSCARSHSEYNGVVGIARREEPQASEWSLLPPLISADELNNELERPHIVHHHGLYYLFWSTQRHVFNPEGPSCPTGLYGMVSESVFGAWAPLNGSGLVLANPTESAAQAYSWWVMPDLSVTSFIDNWGSGSERRFGGTFAPFLRLRLNGDQAKLGE